MSSDHAGPTWPDTTERRCWKSSSAVGYHPPNQHEIEVTVPSGCSYEAANPDRLPNRFEGSGKSTEAFDSQHHSVALIVPSVITRCKRNVVPAASHPESGRITATLKVPAHSVEMGTRPASAPNGLEPAGIAADEKADRDRIRPI